MDVKAVVAVVCMVVLLGITVTAIAVNAQGQPADGQRRAAERLVGRVGAAAIAVEGGSVYVVYMGTLFRFDAQTLQNAGQVELRPAGTEQPLPRDARRTADEANLRKYLLEMRRAIILYGTQAGDLPATLSDLMATKAPETGGTGLRIDPARWRGPYLTTPNMKLPPNPVTGGNVEGVDWVYEPRNGTVRSGAGRAIDGSDYSEW